MPEITKSICPSSRKDWRAWLRKNHKKEKLIWLIHHKRHTGKHFLSHRETLEEAICFGWIDTIVKSIDNDTFARCFIRRTEKSRWSDNTLSYARKMIQEKKIVTEGLKRYKEGLKKPSLDLGIPKNPEPQQDLLKALQQNGKALEYFTHLAPSYKRYYIRWIERAKRPETRKKRIDLVVERCSVSKKPGLP
ncbi:YdeI/OmpD-associated family protein [Candidatus Woesearchaeota archaeon]|nr:YdeI/OmpD-associated family protein [Candidatus Woesearchaeota archaeon]